MGSRQHMAVGTGVRGCLAWREQAAGVRKQGCVRGVACCSCPGWGWPVWVRKTLCVRTGSVKAVCKYRRCPYVEAVCEYRRRVCEKGCEKRQVCVCVYVYEEGCV